MLRNSLRFLLSRKLYSFINIAGLTIGITCVLLLALWVRIETSYDRSLRNYERIYRVGLVIKTPNREINSGSINAPAGPEFRENFPVVEQMVRFSEKVEPVEFNTKPGRLNVFYTDSTFFDIFSFRLLAGDIKTCLINPGSVVVTRSAVKRVFGIEDPVGKDLKMSGKLVTVTGVIDDPPVNSSLQFDCLAQLETLIKEAHVGWDGGLTCYTFLRLSEGADPVLLEKQILSYMDGVINNKYRSAGFSLTPYLQQIRKMHLDTSTEFDLGEKGSMTQVLIFSFVGLLILLIACFNFINMSTAFSFRRSREVSIRKIFGSDRKKIISSSLLESAVEIVISILVAFILLNLILSSVSGLISKPLSLSVISPAGWILMCITLLTFCTLFASFYSALYLSFASPLALLGSAETGKGRQSSRNILVTFQYTISTLLIFCSLVIYSQLNFIRTADKGFNEKNILVIGLSKKAASTYSVIKDRFSSIPGISSVSVIAGGLPGVGFTSNGYMPEGFDKPVISNAVYVDENYLKTMGISLVSGRDLTNSKADSNKVLINETFALLAGWSNPVGKTISRNGIRYEVIGEVKDFSTSTLHKKTEPIFITNVNEWGQFTDILVKYQAGKAQDVLQESEKIARDIDPQSTFEYKFLEDVIDNAYAPERRLNSLFLIFSVIAILISSLGLFGLATFTTRSRMKEISIRKINGATIPDILIKFNSELLRWIIIAYVVACPLGYFVMNRWLANFAFRTTTGTGVFLISGILAAAVGILTVTSASLKAAATNPAETLRTN